MGRSRFYTGGLWLSHLALKAGRGKLGQEASVAQILQDDMICTEILC